MKILIILLVLLIYISMTFIDLRVIDIKDDHFKVEVKGYVLKPGIYDVSYGQMIDDVLALAGPLKDSDTDVLNKSLKLYPNMVINVDKVSEIKKISINSAPIEELCKLPGIKETMAKRIIDYRLKNPFKSLEDIMSVKGIGEKTYEKIKELIAL